MSEKPVAERLQSKGERRLAVLNAPEAVDSRIGVPDRRASVDVADVVLLCVRDRAELSEKLAPALASSASGVIFSYPKLSSPLAGDLDRDFIATSAPRFGLGAVAQIAIDSDWSALRLKQVGKSAS